MGIYRRREQPHWRSEFCEGIGGAAAFPPSVSSILSTKEGAPLESIDGQTGISDMRCCAAENTCNGEKWASQRCNDFTLRRGSFCIMPNVVAFGSVQ